MTQQAHITFSTRYDMRRNSAFILRTFEHLNEHPPTAPTLPETH
jgi:hypothetical protein